MACLVCVTQKKKPGHAGLHSRLHAALWVFRWYVQNAGISEERLAAAYTIGTHSGKRTIDGKRYVQCIVPRRIIPYPFSLGGLIHALFFSAEDPFKPAHFVQQIMRSVTVLSVMVLLTQTWLLETGYSASALYQRAYAYQVSLCLLHTQNVKCPSGKNAHCYCSPCVVLHAKQACPDQSGRRPDNNAMFFMPPMRADAGVCVLLTWPACVVFVCVCVCVYVGVCVCVCVCPHERAGT